MLVPGEMFPTTRLQEDEVEGTAMEGLEHLGQYVFEMTEAKMKAVGANGLIADNIPDEDDEDEAMLGPGDDEEDLTIQQGL